MGSGNSTPPKPAEKHPLGLKPSRTDNASTGAVLPYFCGQGRFGVTWLGPALSQTTTPVTGEGGGGKGSSDSDVSGYDYAADCAGLVCLGPVDMLREVWMDKERVWRGELKRDVDHPHSANVDIEGRGSLTIYWGTEGQTAPVEMSAAGHPAYRGQCWLWFVQLYFGKDKTTAPDVEVVVERSPLNWTGAPVLAGHARIALDAEPIHALVDVLAHPRCGFGFVAGDFDLAHLGATGGKLYAEGLGISPVIDDEMSAGELVEEFCQYIDAWPSFRDGNKLRILLSREPAPFATSYPLIGEYDLVETPKYKTEAMSATVNKVVVKFTDWRRYFEEDSEACVDNGNYAVTRRWRPATLDRPWVTSRTVAQKMARRHARLQSVPLIEATLQVRNGLIDDELSRSARDLVVGGFVRFTYADYAETLLMRVMEKRVPRDRSQAVRLKLQSDRYQDAVLGYTADDVPGPDDDLGVDPGGAAEWEVIELPQQLVQDDPGRQNIAQPYFGAFATRRVAGKLDSRLQVYASGDGSSYERVVDQKSGVWAVQGTLAAALAFGPLVDLDAEIVINIPSDHHDRKPATCAPGDIAAFYRGDCLLYVGGEWIGYHLVQFDTPTGSVTLQKLIRSRFGSVVASHAAGDPVWLISRKALLAYTSTAFRLSVSAADNDVFLKLRTGTKTTMFPLADVPAKTLNVVGVTPQPCPPGNLRFNVSSIYSGAEGASACVAFTWDSVTDNILLLLWEDRAWQRNGFFASWLKPYRGEQSYVITVRPLGWVDGDPEYQLPKLAYPADVHSGFPGTRVAVVTAADVVAELGALPDVFSVTVVAVWRGHESLPVTGWVVVAGTVGVAPTVNQEQPLPMSPSDLRRVVYCTDPEATMVANFGAIAAHWAIPTGTIGDVIKPLAAVKPALAATRTAGNFGTIQAWVRANIIGQSAFTFHSLTGVPEPEWVIEANFEQLNAIW